MRTNEPTYTTEQLCERYGCDPSTIWRKVKKEGFPEGSRFGRTTIRLQRVVHHWEHERLPGLYEEGASAAFNVDEEAHWDRLRELMNEPKPARRHAKRRKR